MAAKTKKIIAAYAYYTSIVKIRTRKFCCFNLEYVDIEKLSIRETYYITHLLPYYNVLKQGYSSIGYKHTEFTKQMLS